MVNDLQLAKRFILFRKKYIGSQSKAAEVCECSQKNISEIERGLTSISLNVLHCLYMKCKLNIDWIFTGAGSMIRGDKPKETLISTIKELKSDIDFTDANIRRLDYLVTKIYNDFYQAEMPAPGNYKVKSGQKPSKKDEKKR